MEIEDLLRQLDKEKADKQMYKDMYKNEYTEHIKDLLELRKLREMCKSYARSEFMEKQDFCESLKSIIYFDDKENKYYSNRWQEIK